MNLPIYKRIYRKILSAAPGMSYQKNRGYCPCCESDTSFISTSSWFRDNYRCIRCMSIPRERALIAALNKYYPEWPGLRIHESSPNDSSASRLLKNKCRDYTGSQYYRDKPKGEIVSGYINQDLEELTFKDESFDIIITQDVFEHINNPVKAFREIHRTLKQGGAHIFTVPVINRFNKTERWGEFDDSGRIKFFRTPEYHGNPVDPQGSPVTFHWGFDIINLIKECTGMETMVEDNYDLSLGLSARYLEVFVSVKRG